MIVACVSGARAVVKLPDNPSGPDALICDLVGTNLAAAIGLATFDVAVTDFPLELVGRQGAVPAFVTRYRNGRP